MKLCIVLGTRPEIIKLSPVIRELAKRKTDYFIIHTNQHYSDNMDAVFFKELKLPLPKYNLGSTRETDPVLMATIMKDKIAPILESEKPDMVIVQGDTNTTLAGASAAYKVGVRVAHVEAGLRSYDQNMPEEYNRIVTDHRSCLLFPPTPLQKNILLEEGIEPDRITVTGNTIVDAVRENLALAKQTPAKSQTKPYILLTMHRSSNVDQKDVLKVIIDNIEALSDEMEVPVVFPIHPRTKKSLEMFGVRLNRNKIHTMEPVGYLEMLRLMNGACLIVTDSGGIQEEACILHIPCVTMRDNTERPETVEVGASVLVGTDRNKLLEGARDMLEKSRNWPNPFGNGNTGKIIVDVLLAQTVNR